MTEMYVWKVTVELEYECNWEENGKKETDTWTETAELTVSAPSGVVAMEKAKRLSLEGAESWNNSDDIGENEPLKTCRLNRVSDFVGLTRRDALDG